METAKNGVLTDIEEIIALVKEHKLSKAFFDHARPYLQAVTGLLRISETQAAFLSLVLEHSDDDAASVSTIAKTIDCGRVQILQYMDDFEALEKKNLIRASQSRFASRTPSTKLPSYHVPMETIKALRTGRVSRNTIYCGLSAEAFFDTGRSLFESRRENEINETAFYAEIKLLFSSNLKSAFVQHCRSFELPIKAGIEMLAFCCAWLEEDTDNISLRDLRPLLGFAEIRNIERRLKTFQHKLAAEGLIINGCEQGLADNETWTLSDKARATFLADLNLKERKQKSKKDIIKAETIIERPMYYGENVNRRITELTALLNEENFASIKTRLAEQNMSAAFTILFQGPPGTGKTETAYQIARLSNRDIFMVDISETKSQWFGESEKRIKAIFDRYKSMLKTASNAPLSNASHCSTTPILFFNEADAVLGKRQELGETRRGPAQTENAIQNIILQEMENLHGGILIATTNMTANFDKAFERRFLYKIEFEKPDITARTAIWRSRISKLAEEDAQTLSRRYDFSGGQIENIARKQAINAVLHGEPDTGRNPAVENLIILCEDELLDKGAKRIGFCTD